MTRFLSRIYLLSFTCLISGCIEFESQTMAYRYDAAKDQLRIFQDYHGIFGAEADGQAGVPLSDQEQEQLKSVLTTQRTFFFANWIFEYDRSGMKTSREELDSPDQTDYEAADLPKIKQLVDLAIKNIRVENGTLYLDDEKKLSGVQRVTIDQFSELVAQLNACMPIFLKQTAKQDDTSKADLEAIAKFRSEPDAKLLQQDGNSLTLRWPMSRASYDETFGPGSDDPESADEARRAGIGIDWQDQQAIVTIGKKDDQITRVTLGVSETTYTPNVQPALPPGHPVKENFNPAAAAKNFLLGKD